MGYIFDEIISDPENGGTLELWNFGILELWYFGTLELWYFSLCAGVSYFSNV